jgi:hypothetical protein
MNTKEAITKANDRRKEQSEGEFQSQVETLLYRIEGASETLRGLKRELTELEYKEPVDLDGN